MSDNVLASSLITATVPHGDRVSVHAATLIGGTLGCIPSSFYTER